MKNSTNVLIISIIVGIVLIGGFIAVGKKNQDNALSLPIKVDEFADFQCPACSQFALTANQIKDIKGVEFTYRHFPLTQIHDRAYQAAIAAEAAREQGKFNEYHDKLYENQENLTDEDFYKYAEDLELDLDKFKSDYNTSEKLKERIAADVKQGEDLEVNSTPTLFVNGKRFILIGKEPQQIVDEIQQMVDKANVNSSPAASPTEQVSNTPEPTSQNEEE